MATNILMPALSPTMTEGTLARWLKKEGDTVTAGDVIAEIETDKATMEVEAVDEGVLGKILVADGTAGVAVNAPIAILVEAGEAVPSGTPAERPRRPFLRRGRRTARRSRPRPLRHRFRPWRRMANGHDRGARVFASPLARRMAKQAGLVAGRPSVAAGPNGRIVKADIEAAPSGAQQGCRATPPAVNGRGAASMAAAAPAPKPVVHRRQIHAGAQHQHAQGRRAAS